jgi:hypothetical protein
MLVNSATSSRSLLSDLKGPILTVLVARTVLAGVGIALYAAGGIPTTDDPTLRPDFGQSPVTGGPARTRSAYFTMCSASGRIAGASSCDSIQGRRMLRPDTTQRLSASSAIVGGRDKVCK